MSRNICTKPPSQDPQAQTQSPPTVHPLRYPVFWFSSLTVGMVLAASMAKPVWTSRFLATALSAVLTHLGSGLLLSIAALIVLCIAFVAGPTRHLRLGPPGSKPEFSTTSWMAMLFGAGMGIGLVFFGTAEPLLHAQTSAVAPVLVDQPAGWIAQPDAADRALALTYFHWGIHAWAIYAIMGLVLAYTAYRSNMPLSLRSALVPLVGKRWAMGALGQALEVLAVLGTLFGLATSLAAGAQQIGAGLNHVLGTQNTLTLHLWIIVGVTGLATISVVSGLKRGVQLLSRATAVLAFILWLAVLILGPTAAMIDGATNSFGLYLGELVQRTFWNPPGNPAASEWLGSWTLFYWAWWTAWAPFVGLFIARISRGRTVGEFLTGVWLAPTGLTLAWFAVFGAGALASDKMHGGALSQAAHGQIATAIYAFLEALPYGGTALSILTILVVAAFFVTSSDSGSLVVDTITSAGHPSPPIWTRVFWACIEGSLAAILLSVGGGSLKALQSGVLVLGTPFAFLLVIMGYTVFRKARREIKIQDQN